MIIDSQSFSGTTKPHDTRRTSSSKSTSYTYRPAASSVVVVIVPSVHDGNRFRFLSWYTLATTLSPTDNLGLRRLMFVSEGGERRENGFPGRVYVFLVLCVYMLAADTSKEM